MYSLSCFLGLSQDVKHLIYDPSWSDACTISMDSFDCGGVADLYYYSGLLTNDQAPRLIYKSPDILQRKLIFCASILS